VTFKQVFAGYDRKTHRASGRFRYCPFCQTPLNLLEIGHRQRPACPACGFTQYRNPAPTISVLVVDGDRVLLGQRRGPPGKGRWALPSGYVEWQDDFLTTGIQEVQEETGLDVEIVSILNVVSSFLSPRWHFLSIYLLARIAGGELAAGDDLAKVAWFPASGPWPETAFEEDVAMLEMMAGKEFAGLPVDPEFSRPGVL
jgi:8-oxo-dGTP diphosphatase